ncbi:hypothetical protein AD871_12505 [Shigella flexneri 4c]|nr:hypothetical protein AD871_12505 [Shigella flexneri 4c]
MTFKGLRIFFRPDNTNRRCVGAFALLFFTVLICINFRIQRVTETRYLSGDQVRETGNDIPVVNHRRVMEIPRIAVILEVFLIFVLIVLRDISHSRYFN